jgi:hypothetical protein
MSELRQDDHMTVHWAIAVLMSSLLTAFATAAHSYSSGPPDGYAGAPGEETCFTCHDGFPVNSGPGVFAITAPEEFAAGETYQIVVSLEQAGPSRWGFEFTPLEVGTCTITDAQNTQSSTSGANTYVKQTTQGTYSGSAGPAVWTFDWAAPEDPPEEVVFYAAGNAANGNGVTSGDYVYTAFALSILTPASADDGTGSATLGLTVRGTPNPVRESATISYSVPAGAAATLAIHDAHGRLVADLCHGDAPAGTHQATWHGTDDDGRPVAPGLYVCTLTSLGRVETTRLVLVR